MIATADFKTDKAARYMKALCNHFGSKVDAKYENNRGWINFPFGRCELQADDDRLSIHVEGNDSSTLRQVKKIVSSHLKRFTQNELVSLDWRDEQNIKEAIA